MVTNLDVCGSLVLSNPVTNDFGLSVEPGVYSGLIFIPKAFVEAQIRDSTY